MDFNIYVLGDVRLFADTLNGIAMMFTVASGERINLWAANTNSMGLGMGAFLGVLMALCLLVYNAAFRQRFDYRALIIPLVIYIILTVPKVRVNVIDAYYRDGAQTVDNVPMGLALPMAAISSIAMAATETLETVFTVPNDSFTRITDDGFVMPLKLLHAMRYTGLTMQDAYPNVTESIAEAVKICLTNNDAFDIKQYQNSGNGFGVFVTALADPSVAGRLVKIYPSTAPLGQVTNCETAAKWISGSMQAYMNGAVGGGGALSLISNSELKVRNFKNDLQKILASNNGNTGSRNLTDATLSSVRVMDDIQALTTASNTEVLQFAQLTLFNPQLSAASQCAQSTDNNSTARCFTYITTEEQWKERSAAEASGFLSIMRDGQNLLILLSVTLFPIMVLIVVLQGLGGLKVVMSYLLYTISAYMWIPVAAMINWYVQLQLHDELQKWKMSVPAGVSVADAYLSAANAPLFYDAISKKLALANSVMASVPMICMGLFSGMLMTMNRLADKMNPQTGYDASANTPAAISRDSLAKVGSGVSFEGANSVGKQSGLVEMGTVNAANQISQANADMKANNSQLSKSLSQMAAKDIYMSKDLASQVEMSKVLAKQMGFTDAQTNSFANTKGTAFNVMKGMAIASALGTMSGKSEQEAIKMAQSVAAAIGIDTKGLNSAAAIQATFGKEFAAMLSTNLTTSDQFQRLSQTTGVNVDSQTANHMDSQTAQKIWTETNASAFKEMTTDSKGYSQKLTSTETFAKADSLIKQTSQTNQELMQQGLKFEAPFSQLANANKAMGGDLNKNLKEVTAGWGREFDNRVAAIKASSAITVNRGDAEAVDFQARYLAAQEQSPQRRFEANHAVLKDLATTPPVNNLEKIDNSGLEKEVGQRVAGVGAAVAGAYKLNEADVDNGASALKNKAEGQAAAIKPMTTAKPAPTHHRVGNEADAVEALAKREEKAIKEKVAEEQDKQFPVQPDGTRQDAEIKASSLAVNALNANERNQNTQNELTEAATDQNRSWIERAIISQALPATNMAAAGSNAIVEATGVENAPVVMSRTNRENPAKMEVTRVTDVATAKQEGIKMNNLSAPYSPSAVIESIDRNKDQLTGDGIANAIREAGENGSQRIAMGRAVQNKE